MLSFFRGGGVGQAVIGAVVFAIIVVFVVEFRAGGRAKGSVNLTCAAKVYGSCVHRKEYDAAYRLAAPHWLDQKQLNQLELARAVLDGLVERELLIHEAEQLGLGIGEDGIDDELEGGRIRVSLPAARAEQLAKDLGLCVWIPNPLVPDPKAARQRPVCAPGGPLGVRYLDFTDNKTGRFQYKIYERAIRVRANRSPKEFKEMQRRELVAERMREIIRSWVDVSEQDAWAAYERDRTTVKVRYASLKRDWFGKYGPALSDEVVDAWAQDNEAQVKDAWGAAKAKWSAGCPLASEIRVSFQPGSSDAEKVALRERIDGAAQRLKQGEPFARVAREISDAGTALEGGALGCLTAANYGPGGDVLLETIAGKNPGYVSPVVETTLGFHIVRYDGLTDESNLETLGKRQVARHLAARFKTEAAAKKFGDELIVKLKSGARMDATVSELSRAYVVQNLGRDPTDEDLPGLQDPDRPQSGTSDWTSRFGSPVPGVGPFNDLASVALALKKPGDVHPEPVAVMGGVVVLQLDGRRPAKREDFEKEKLELMRMRQYAKASAALTDHVAALREAAQAQITLDMELVGQVKGGAKDDEDSPAPAPDVPDDG